LLAKAVHGGRPFRQRLKLMITTHDFSSVVAVQTAVFTPGGMPPWPRFIASVLSSHAHRYGGDITSLPLPEHIPAEVPRVVLQSTDGAHRLEAARSRMNAHWQAADGGVVDIAAIARECSEVQVALARHHHLRVGRLALIVTRVCRVEQPAQTLIERFCSPQAQREPFNRSATFEIHNHKQYTPRQADSRWVLNSWVRCKTATLLMDRQPAVLVEQDLNTLAEELEASCFTPDQTLQFFELAAREVEEIFALYFPARE